MRSFLNNLIEYLYNIKWNTVFYSKLIFQPDFRKSINANKKFKNIHHSQRCFIVGNGPSLKKLNLTGLKNEIVFTVNEIMNNRSLYETIYTDYHVFIDPFYFGLNPQIVQENAVINLLKETNYENKKPICISCYNGKNALKKYGLDKILDLNYIYHTKTLTNSSSKIDMSRNMPSAQNVIHAAIYTAIYMGFKKIYLIGVDMTSVFLTYEANDDGEQDIVKNLHSYNYSTNDILNMTKSVGIRDNEYMLNEYARTFTIFKRIKKYAEKYNIEIINATKGGALDVFKRVNFDSIFQ